jgi:prepilin peptidase CpaA
MILVFIIVFCALIALGFGGAAAWSDATRLKIPNLYAAYIGAAFFPAFLLHMFFASEVTIFASFTNHLIAAFVVLGVTYIMFYLKLLGGGDSKLLSVYALWTGLSGLLPFLFFMSLIGGALGLSTLLLNKNKFVEKPTSGSWIDKSQKGGKDVPYGVAIFLGALITFWQVGYIAPDTLIDMAQAMKDTN